MGEHLARTYPIALMYHDVHDHTVGSRDHLAALARQDLEWSGWVVRVRQERDKDQRNADASPYHRPPRPPRGCGRGFRFGGLRLAGHYSPEQLELLPLALRAHRPEAEKP